MSDPRRVSTIQIVSEISLRVRGKDPGLKSEVSLISVDSESYGLWLTCELTQFRAGKHWY